MKICKKCGGEFIHTVFGKMANGRSWSDDHEHEWIDAEFIDLLGRYTNAEKGEQSEPKP